MLYIFGGLPGTGKTSLSMQLARRLPAVHLRMDTIEQAMLRAGVAVRGPEGYLVGYAVAADNLQLGLDVIADSVNSLTITRQAWREVATACGVAFCEIEVVCSDRREHQRRVEERRADILGHTLPTWQAVVEREYEPWDSAHIVLDTAGQTLAQSVAALERLLPHSA